MMIGSMEFSHGELLPKHLKKFREVTKIIESTDQKRDNDSVAPAVRQTLQKAASPPTSKASRGRHTKGRKAAPNHLWTERSIKR